MTAGVRAPAVTYRMCRTLTDRARARIRLTRTVTR
jgi:hypothetical protein